MNKYYGIYVSLIAGLSTMLGYFSIYIKGDKDNIISKSLSFAGGVMITLSLIDLIPTSIKNFNMNSGIVNSIIYVILFFLIGYFLCNFISNKINNSDELYNAGMISMIGIILHNIPEGIATYILSTIDLKLGILLSIAIIFHNIPEGVSISIPIYYSTNNKKKAFLYTFISSISEPFGALISMIFLYKYINNEIIGILFSIISGLMFYIGYNKMIIISREYSNKLIYSLYGSIFILIIEIILKI